MDTLTRRTLAGLTLDTSGINSNPYLKFLQQQIIIDQRTTAFQRTSLLPDFNIGYSNQSLIGTQTFNGNDVYYGSGKRFHAFQFGVSIPIFNGASRARIKASELNEKVSRNQLDLTSLQLTSSLQQAIQTYQSANQSLDLYERNTLVLADVIRNNATRAYEGGDIGYVEFAQSLNRALNIKSTYLNLLDSYNQSVIEIEFLLNRQ